VDNVTIGYLFYFGTLDGEWLTDEKGNKVKAQGTDGKDGVDGEDGNDGADGEDGTDGTNGKDGITPLLRPFRLLHLFHLLPLLVLYQSKFFHHPLKASSDHFLFSSGTIPVIGVRKDTDGCYYWTLDGEWLTDEKGNKMPFVPSLPSTPSSPSVPSTPSFPSAPVACPISRCNRKYGCQSHCTG